MFVGCSLPIPIHRLGIILKREDERGFIKILMKRERYCAYISGMCHGDEVCSVSFFRFSFSDRKVVIYWR